MRRKTPAERIKTERLLMVLSAVFACVGAAFTTVTIFSAIATIIDLSDGTYNIMSSAALCAGCFAAAYTAAKRRKKQGLRVGLACGGIIFAVTLLLGIIFVKGFSAGGFFTKLLIILACSAVGGIIGVNSPKRFR